MNYFVVSAICIYMVQLYYGKENLWLLVVPFLYFSFQVISLFLSGLLSGELKKLNEHFLLLNFTYHFIGLLLIPVLIIWLLNVDYSIYFIYAVAGIFSAFWILRVTRGILFALRNKILWYYIILYLCTLEIWPLMVIFKLLTADLEG